MADDQPPALLLVRFRRGVVGETHSVVHLVPAPTGNTMPETLTPYCGTEIRPGQAEWLQKPTGMPCVPCLARAPQPDIGASLPQSSDSQ